MWEIITNWNWTNILLSLILVYIGAGNRNITHHAYLQRELLKDRWRKEDNDDRIRDEWDKLYWRLKDIEKTLKDNAPHHSVIPHFKSGIDDIERGIDKLWLKLDDIYNK